jgi:hypothetical protein
MENNIKVLSYSGKAQSGKGASVDYIKNLLQEDGYYVIEFNHADYLKFALDKYFNLGVDKYNPDTGYKFTKEELREDFQLFGTEFLREDNPDFHIDLTVSVIKAMYRYAVEKLKVLEPKGMTDVIFQISDSRFCNEINKLMMKFDSYFINVRRDHDSGLSKTELAHASENGLDMDDDEWDYIVNNDGSIEELYNKLDVMYEDIQRVLKL